MKSNFFSSSSILRKFLFFNLVVFLVLGVFTFLYLKAIKPNLVENRSAEHLRIINNTLDHINRLNIKFTKESADRLAEAGFLTVAPDFYHRHKEMDAEEAVKLRNDDEVIADISATLRHLNILDNDKTKGENEWKSFECRIDVGLNKIFDILEGAYDGAYQI